MCLCCMEKEVWFCLTSPVEAAMGNFLELLLVLKMAHRVPSSQRASGYRTLKDLTVPEDAARNTSNPSCRSLMNQGNPPPYPGPGPSAPYPPYPQQPMGPAAYPPGPVGGPYPPPQGYPNQGYPQYGWQGGPQEPPKTTVYVVEDQRRDDLGTSTCLTACWTALCCCCLWDMLT
ncbi:cysteine-rich and transmembrane domain-containing protein 1 isoform X1 [Camelus dromedarius]|uniref:Cysteine-rich and transmembrane domain-containing protein 1 n=2 Tax=Camelus TaxID=9836 RepID=A0A8B6Y8Z3_CAMFR|nr:cysteine-rich and transmembrane domain-containing protein 1 isoform X2 [Camelus ferus]XP_031305001.1 cysteine-rich and transmembrane domain-containing protein 1 isoform X3 [Camelus dromedarius]XP_045363920.1 cysteine-rich and transmembrane domain-containing protein 1 isoform X2 [Camelus bactrianus]